MACAHRMAGNTLALIATALALASGARLAGAQPSPSGDEFQVNTYTSGEQCYPAVAVDSLGNVVWTSDRSTAYDPSYWRVLAQRYSPTGAPLGGEFQINAHTTSHQRQAAVAASAQGELLVAWASSGSSDTDTSSWGIEARRFGATGAPLGEPFQVNSYTTGKQLRPAVAYDAQGRFVIAWDSLGSSGTDSASYSIQAQRYDAQGIPLGAQFQVNSYSPSAQVDAAVAADPGGKFIVAWTSVGSSASDAHATSIQAQRYNDNGLPIAGQFQVNTYTTDYQWFPAVAADTLGNALVVWESIGSSGADTHGLSVQAQRYDADGAPLGGEFQVNSYTTSHQYRPAAATDGHGGFVIAWASAGSAGTDTSAWSVQAQRFAQSGAPLGEELQVNTYTTDYQWFPAVAADALGNFVVVWESYGSNGLDTSAWSVQARRYDDLFRDGFESGGLGRWSSAVPAASRWATPGTAR